MAPITLFDIASKSPRACWTPNPWKIRLALNYKGLEYETQWLEYPDIEPTLKSLGVHPNDEPGAKPYTCPTVHLSDGTYVTDSAEIVEAIETQHPIPSLHLDSPVLARVQQISGQTFMGLIPEWMPSNPRLIFNDVSAEYYERTRAEEFGMPLAQVARERGGEQCWEAAKEPMRELPELLSKDDTGPFFLGAEGKDLLFAILYDALLLQDDLVKPVSYADLFLVAYLRFAAIVGIYERIVTAEPAFADLYKACGKWFFRDDY